jgi:hypothetical protein
MHEIKLMKVELVNIHSEPTWMAPIAKQIGHKVVVDIGDLDTLRSGTVQQHEVDMLNSADGIVYNSETYKEAIIKNGIKITENDATVYPCANKKFYIEPLTRKGGIVFQGSILSPFLSSGRYDYRNIFPLLDACQDMKIKISVFPSGQSFGHSKKDYLRRYHKFSKFQSNDPYPEYIKGNYVFMFNPVSYEELITEMGNYHWGFMGTHVKDSYMNHVMPHKLFDYMASGIPVMVMNMKKTSEFVEREGVGVTINEFSDIKKYYHLWKEKQQAVLEVRDKWAMENHIHKVMNVFQEALKGGTNV